MIKFKPTYFIAVLAAGIVMATANIASANSHHNNNSGSANNGLGQIHCFAITANGGGCNQGPVKTKPPVTKINCFAITADGGGCNQGPVKAKPPVTKINCFAITANGGGCNQGPVKTKPPVATTGANSWTRPLQNNNLGGGTTGKPSAWLFPSLFH